MSDRLSPLDVSFLYMEELTTPMHVGGVAIFEAPEGGFDYERLVRLIRDRIALVPRYRQRVRWVPGHLANPVWVDDEQFDVTYHVRRSALPRPGTDDQLNDLVARIMSRPAGPGPPAVGDVPRRGARGRPLRDPHQDPPRDGRRRQRRSTSARSSSTSVPSRATCRRTPGARCASPRRWSSWPVPSTRSPVPRRPSSTPCAPG